MRGHGLGVLKRPASLEENQPASALDLQRLVQQRRGKDDGSAAVRPVALIAKLGKPEFTARKFLSVQI